MEVLKNESHGGSVTGLIGSIFAMKRQKKITESESAEKIVPVLQEGMIADFITGQPVKKSEKEDVRQEVAAAAHDW